MENACIAFDFDAASLQKSIDSFGQVKSTFQVKVVAFFGRKLNKNYIMLE